MKGHYASAGFLSTNAMSEENCDILKILWDLGAGEAQHIYGRYAESTNSFSQVFYVKTNQPQGIMHLESQSFHGRTLNPHNLNLSKSCFLAP
jgi:amidase